MAKVKVKKSFVLENIKLRFVLCNGKNTGDLYA